MPVWCSRARVAAVVVVHARGEVREVDLAAAQRPAQALVAAGAHEHGVHHPPVHGRLDQPRSGAAEEAAGQLHQLADAARVAPGGQVQRRAERLRRLGEREDRVGHVVDRNDVDRAPSRGPADAVGAAREGPQRPVEDVEAGVQPLSRSPTTMLGRTTVIGIRRAPAFDDPLGLELRALIRVAKTLADVEVVLAEGPGVLPRDVRRRE